MRLWATLLFVSIVVVVVCTESTTRTVIVEPQHSVLPQNVKFIETEKAAIVSRFLNYLRINTAQPNPDYESATRFLTAQAERIGLSVHTIKHEPSGKPSIVLEWIGKSTNKSAQSLMLNSHTDVVPVEKEKWKYDAFAAVHEAETGNIYARGAQDMKCVGMQYLEAIDVLKNKLNYEPPVPVYVSFVADEEIGGTTGMGVLTEDSYFAKMNVGLSLDEGLASETDIFKVYYGERVPFWFIVEALGQPGHGSSFITDTATEKIARFIEKAFEFRRNQELAMKLYGKKSGDVISINLTSMKAGQTSDGGKTFSMNVIPGFAQAGFDLRFPPQVQLSEIKELIGSWIKPDNLTIRVIQTHATNPMTDLNDPRVQAFMHVMHSQLQLRTETLIFPASTDARYLRYKNIPVIGFSPIVHTPILLHDHNEYLNDKIYLNGIEIYVALIRHLTETLHKQ